MLSYQTSTRQRPIGGHLLPVIQAPCVVTRQNGGVQICRKRSDYPLLAFDGLFPGHDVLAAHPHEGVIIPTAASQ